MTKNGYMSSRSCGLRGGSCADGGVGLGVGGGVYTEELLDLKQAHLDS